MGLRDILAPAALAALLLGAAPPAARAGPFDGVAGAAVGFALGAMVAGAARPAPVYGAPRVRRVVVYRDRRPVRRFAAAPRRRPVAGPVRGAAINTASDPFAGSGGPRPIPVSGR